MRSQRYRAIKKQAMTKSTNVAVSGNTEKNHGGKLAAFGNEVKDASAPSLFSPQWES